MPILALAFVAIWIAANVYLWSLEQGQPMMFLESVGMAAIMYPALYWYVRR
jgi:hypothetical protein